MSMVRDKLQKYFDELVAIWGDEYVTWFTTQDDLENIDQKAVILNYTYTNAKGDARVHFSIVNLTVYLFDSENTEELRQLDYHEDTETEINSKIQEAHIFTKEVLIL